MQHSKILISQALATLKDNMDRTGDPLGFKKPYWTDWADGKAMAREGSTVLLTARMYQMLPYVIQETELVESARSLLPLLSVKAFAKMVAMGNAMAGETIVRLKARGAKDIRIKGDTALTGILAALRRAGQDPAYLYEKEPYSGVLLYDLGLEEEIAPHVRKVYQQLKNQGVRQVITVDPHTTHMLREVYPKYILNYDLQVKHYLEVLAENTEKITGHNAKDLPEDFVLHDSCVMTRDLDIIEQARQVTQRLGIKLLEPENCRQNTACCGGPVEYAYGDLSCKISRIRIQELAAVSKNIVVTCPICLINFSKYEKELGIRVWDMGELLDAAIN